MVTVQRSLRILLFSKYAFDIKRECFISGHLCLLFLGGLPVGEPRPCSSENLPPRCWNFRQYFLYGRLDQSAFHQLVWFLQFKQSVSPSLPLKIKGTHSMWNSNTCLFNVMAISWVFSVGHYATSLRFMVHPHKLHAQPSPCISHR